MRGRERGRVLLMDIIGGWPALLDNEGSLAR